MSERPTCGHYCDRHGCQHCPWFMISSNTSTAAKDLCSYFICGVQSSTEKQEV